MAIQSRFALLLTLCLFATSALAIPVPASGVPSANPDANEIVGQNTITALGTPMKVPRAGLSAASLPFFVNPDTLPLLPAHGAPSKRDPRYTNDLHASSPMKAVQLESDHQGQKPPLSARAAPFPQHVDGAKLSRRADDTTTSFKSPMNVVKGSSHGYSGRDAPQTGPKKTDETMQATGPGDVSVQDHKYQERQYSDAKFDATKLSSRKDDETTEFATPLKAVDVQDHKYADSPSQGIVPSTPSSSSSPLSSLPLPGKLSGMKQARKHDQKTEVETIMGGEADYHPYSDERKRAEDVQLGRVQTRKHDETMHMGTLLGGAVDYHPYSDNRKRSKDQTVHETAPLGGLVDYHRYNDKREEAPTSVPFTDHPFAEHATMFNSARSPRATAV